MNGKVEVKVLMNNLFWAEASSDGLYERYVWHCNDNQVHKRGAWDMMDI